MTVRIVVTLEKEERQALSTLAEREYRNPRAQAALIIRRELERCGLLQCDDSGAISNLEPMGVQNAEN